jgi:Concanavalin A-like lectin/glucanases superfamily
MLNLPSSAINIGNPVNTSHPLNFERVAWWKVLRPWTGGDVFYDIVQGPSGFSNGVMSGTNTPPPAWSANSHAGGDGSILFPAQSGTVGAIQSISVNQIANAPTTNTATFSAWVNPIGFTEFGAVLATHNEMGIIMSGGTSNSQGNPPFTVCWNDTSAEFRANTGLFPTLNAWQFVVGVINGSSETTYLINPQGSLSSFNQTITSTARSLNVVWGLGSTAADAGRPWVGNLDDISIWSRALSLTEILQLYDLSQRGYPGVLNRNKPFLFVPSSVVIVPGSANLTSSSTLTCQGSLIKNGSASCICESTFMASAGLPNVNTDVHGIATSITPDFRYATVTDN